VHRRFLEQNPSWQKLAQKAENDQEKVEEIAQNTEAAELQATTSQESSTSAAQINQLDPALLGLPSQEMPFIDPVLLAESQPTTVAHQVPPSLQMMVAHSLPIPLNSTVDRLIYESLVRRGSDGATMNVGFHFSGTG